MNNKTNEILTVGGTILGLVLLACYFMDANPLTFIKEVLMGWLPLFAIVTFIRKSAKEAVEGKK